MGLSSCCEGYIETDFNVLDNATDIVNEWNINQIFTQGRINLFYLKKKKKRFDEYLNATSIELSGEESCRT